MLLHVFGHIYTYHSLLTSEYCFCQSFGKFCLTHACRPQKQERTNRTAGVFQTYPASLYSLGNCLYSLFLTYYTLMKLFFKMCQSLCFSLCQLLYRDSGPLRNRVCHCILIDNFAASVFPCIFFFAGIQFCLQLFLTVLDFFCHGKICSLYGSFFFFSKRQNLLFQFFYIRTGLIILKSYFGRCLINHINCLIRKETVIDVSDRHFYCCFQCIICNLHTMMLLVIGFQPFQDFQSFLFGRLLYCHRLETSLERCILLDIFPVFFQGCSSDQLDLSSGKRRFQNIGCIQSTFCATCTNDGMKLIDKE